VPRPQILRDKAHGRAVAAMARDQDQLLDAGTRDTFTERHPGFQRRIRRQRQRAWIVGMFGGNPDRLNRKERRRKAVAEKLAHPRQIGLCDHDVSAQGQMRTMLFSGRQRQDRDPARRRVPGEVRPVDVGPVAGGNG
jgi:hypothetical protein